ncbi:MAG: molybdopterin-dependent oxidoreductase [Epsilonproteobacteria bacterium]|nr:molybdopterin-dependent oxidoreductase [Campylobacterota bacterium]
MKSVCTYCGVGCEIEATVSNGKIEKISPVKDGVSSGGELCIKGRYGYEFLNNRLKEHLISYEFIEKNAPNLPFDLQVRIANLIEWDERFYKAPYSLAVDLCAWKLKEIISKTTPKSVAFIGGARTSVESAWLFQHVAREVIKTPHIDNCARICHSPSLSGLKMSIGEGASSVDFDSIYDADTIFVIGSNTTQAHPMVANRIIKAKKNGARLVVVDVREIALMKFADIAVVLPFESNLLFLNAIAKELIENNLYNKEFVEKRCVKFEEYKQTLLNDKYSKDFFEKLSGFEKIKVQIEKIARLLCQKTVFIWGLGVTEHIDGTESVNAISNLAMLCGSFTKGGGVLPLRGQNNVQGACDVGCLPYFLPDYVRPSEDKIGLMSPDMFEEMIKGDIKALVNMGEDLIHVHPNLNKVNDAINSLEFLASLEVIRSKITDKADIVFATKSAYEKEGVYVNAERRLHLSEPIIPSSLPDDWQVLSDIAKRFGVRFDFECCEDVFNACKKEVKRFSGATYEKLKQTPLQWGSDGVGAKILHTQKFSTPDGKGHFHYHKYHIRGEVQDIVDGVNRWYLNTGRALAQYNNASQTKHSQKLTSKYKDDVLLVNPAHKNELGECVILSSKYGKSGKLMVKYTQSVRKYTLFCTFHFAKNKINYLFGNESDHKVKTARFKALEVEVIPVGDK